MKIPRCPVHMLVMHKAVCCVLGDPILCFEHPAAETGESPRAACLRGLDDASPDAKPVRAGRFRA